MTEMRICDLVDAAKSCTDDLIVGGKVIGTAVIVGRLTNFEEVSNTEYYTLNDGTGSVKIRRNKAYSQDTVGVEFE